MKAIDWVSIWSRVTIFQRRWPLYYSHITVKSTLIRVSNIFHASFKTYGDILSLNLCFLFKKSVVLSRAISLWFNFVDSVFILYRNGNKRKKKKIQRKVKFGDSWLFSNFLLVNLNSSPFIIVLFIFLCFIPTNLQFPFNCLFCSFRHPFIIRSLPTTLDRQIFTTCFTGSSPTPTPSITFYSLRQFILGVPAHLYLVLLHLVFESYFVSTYWFVNLY